MKSNWTEQSKYMAKELFRYFSNPGNKTDLMTAINEMEIQYTEPLNNWFYGYFYQYFRTRPETIDALKNQIQDSNLPNEWIRKLIHFFQQGKWTTTSANTCLMQNCLKKLPCLIENKVNILAFELNSLEQIYHFLVEQANFHFQSKNVYFYDLLKYHFAHIETRINAQSAFKKAYNQDLLTRAFDDIPFSIISETEIAELQSRFQSILLNTLINIELEIITDADKKRLMHWELFIIEIAINNLLNDNLKIKPEILMLLDCQEHLSSQQTIELICAYVGRVNHQIIMQSLEFIQQHNKQDTYVALCNYINKNYGKWVEFSLKKENKNNNHLYIWSAVGVGSTLLISAAAIGIVLFKQSTAQNNAANTEINHFKNSGTKF